MNCTEPMSHTCAHCTNHGTEGKFTFMNRRLCCLLASVGYATMTLCVTTFDSHLTSCVMRDQILTTYVSSPESVKVQTNENEWTNFVQTPTHFMNEVEKEIYALSKQSIMHPHCYPLTALGTTHESAVKSISFFSKVGASIAYYMSPPFINKACHVMVDVVRTDVNELTILSMLGDLTKKGACNAATSILQSNFTPHDAGHFAQEIVRPLAHAYLPGAQEAIDALQHCKDIFFTDSTYAYQSKMNDMTLWEQFLDKLLILNAIKYKLFILDRYNFYQATALSDNIQTRMDWNITTFAKHMNTFDTTLYSGKALTRVWDAIQKNEVPQWKDIVIMCSLYDNISSDESKLIVLLLITATALVIQSLHSVYTTRVDHGLSSADMEKVHKHRLYEDRMSLMFKSSVLLLELYVLWKTGCLPYIPINVGYFAFRFKRLTQYENNQFKNLQKHYRYKLNQQPTYKDTSNEEAPRSNHRRSFQSAMKFQRPMYKV